MEQERMYSNLKNLDYVRVSRTKEELRAANYIFDKIKEYGGEGFIEDFVVTDWKTSKASLSIDGKDYNVTAYGTSNQTNGPMTKEFFYLDTISKTSKQNAKGKIVLVNNYLSYDLYKEIVESGAVGFITYSNELYEDETNSDLDERELRPQLQEIKKLPGVHMRTKDAFDLVMKNPKYITMEIEQTEFTSKSQNVIGYIKGEEDDEVVFTAHYDSVPFSHGVYDNASGSVIIIELYRYFLEHKPQKSLRFIWCGSEERGLLGSKAYVNKHQDELEKIKLCINIDVAGPVLGKDGLIIMAYNKAKKDIETLCDKLGLSFEVSVGTYSSDSIPFSHNNIPSLNIYRYGSAQTAYIHSRKDSLSFMSKDALYKTFNQAKILSSYLINSKKEIIERKIDKSMNEKINEYLKIKTEK